MHPTKSPFRCLAPMLAAFWATVAWTPTLAANKLIEFDAAVAGVGITPSDQGWTRSGTAMTNNGLFLLQDQRATPGEQYGEYKSPLLPVGTFTRGGGDYGIEFRVQPLSDVAFTNSAWPNMYLTWSDNQFNYNVHVDLFGQAAASGIANGEIAYGRGSFTPAITGIDWSVPRSVFIGHRGNGAASTFDFYLDGTPISSVSDGSIARPLTGFEGFENRVGFGDGTTGGNDVAGEWHSVRVWDVNSPGQALPKPLHTRQPRQTKAVDIFVGGVGYPNYRTPTLVTALNGTLIAMVEGRTGDEPGFGGDTDLVMKRSFDNGATWTPLQVIESPRTFGEKMSNPVTFLDESNGRVWVMYNRNEGNLGTVDSQPGTRNNTAWARHSDDSGATWSDAIDVTMAVKDYNNWNSVAFGPGSGIQAQDGRLIVPSARWVNGWRSYAVYSDDHGVTWERGELTPGGNLSGEDSFVELADGSIRMDARSNTAAVAPRSNFISPDGGETWGPVIDGQPAVSVHAAIQRHSLVANGHDHNRIMWTGPRGPDRTDLVVRTSYDEGTSYWRERLLYDGYSGYSDMTDLPDGMTGVLFETNEARNITFTSYNLEFVEPPAGLHAYDGFRYQSATLLGTKNGGMGFKGGWSQTAGLTGSSNAIVEASDLHYANMPFITEGQRRAFFVNNAGGSMSRELETPLKLNRDETFFFSMLIRQDNVLVDNEGSNESLRISLLSGTDQIVEFGAQGNEGLFVDLLGNQSATAADHMAKGSTYYLIAKLVAQDSSMPGNYDQLFLSALPTGATVPITDEGMNWTLASSMGFNSSEALDRILITGGAGTTWVLDELRIGTDFGAVVSNRFGGMPGDFNGDSMVDASDLAAWRVGFGMDAGADFSNGDSDGDGDVDGTDFLTWQRNVGMGVTSIPAASVVPEPAAIVLGAVAIAGLFTRQKSRQWESQQRALYTLALADQPGIGLP